MVTPNTTPLLQTNYLYPLSVTENYHTRHHSPRKSRYHSPPRVDKHFNLPAQKNFSLPIGSFFYYASINHSNSVKSKCQPYMGKYLNYTFNTIINQSTSYFTNCCFLHNLIESSLLTRLTLHKVPAISSP